MKKVLSVLLLATAASAKPVHAPLPPEAYTAKTIAIINHTGKQSVTDRAYEELQKWGRYTVVSDPAKADMAEQQEPFFSETERANLFRKSATKRCVDDFRKRIEETPQP